MNKKQIFIVAFILCGLFDLTLTNDIKTDIYQSKIISGTRYVVADDGKLMLYVNVWGQVKAPGRLLVDEGTNIVTVLSSAGGPLDGANLKNIKVYREIPDENGKSMYSVNMQNYFDLGDPSQLVQIKPNDIIIVDETLTAVLLSKINVVNTMMGIANLYFTIRNIN